jgi:hypothetical protein
MPSRARRRLEDLESSGLSHNPHFIEIVNRSWASYEKSGGVSLDEMRRRHVERKPRRRKDR